MNWDLSHGCSCSFASYILAGQVDQIATIICLWEGAWELFISQFVWHRPHFSVNENWRHRIYVPYRLLGDEAILVPTWLVFDRVLPLNSWENTHFSCPWAVNTLSDWWSQLFIVYLWPIFGCLFGVPSNFWDVVSRHQLDTNHPYSRINNKHKWLTILNE